jgi:hypothetical protein
MYRSNIFVKSDLSKQWMLGCCIRTKMMAANTNPNPDIIVEMEAYEDAQ